MINKDYIDILQIPDDIGYWLIRADGGRYYDDFFLNNFVAVSDNEIKLHSITDLNDNSIAGITIDHVKELYNRTYPKWTNQQIAHAASRTHKFFADIKKGDFVLVPSRRSTHFLLGIIESDVYEINEETLTAGEKVQYSISPYLKRRKVNWIKEISRPEISEKLYWVLSAHQTIFDLKEDKSYINQLVAPIYVQDGKCHGTIQIAKRKGLNADDWYNLHSVIKKYSEESEDEVIIKTNVQSPGLIEFLSFDPVTVVSITLVLSGVLIGDVSVWGIKFKGIIPYIQSYRKNEKELEIMEEDKISKQIKNERDRFELEKDKELWEKEKETEIEIKKQLQISSFDAGRIVGVQTQKDTPDDPSVD